MYIYARFTVVTPTAYKDDRLHSPTHRSKPSITYVLFHSTLYNAQKQIASSSIMCVYTTCVHQTARSRETFSHPKSNEYFMRNAYDMHEMRCSSEHEHIVKLMFSGVFTSWRSLGMMVVFGWQQQKTMHSITSTARHVYEKRERKRGL